MVGLKPVADGNAIKFEPKYAEAYNNLGNTLRDQGKTEEAINSY